MGCLQGSSRVAVVCEQQETRNSYIGDEGSSGQMLCTKACGPVYVCVCVCVCVFGGI